MDSSVNLKEMSIEALSAVIGAYPWFGAARKELCVRTGGGSGEQYADAAMYIASRRKLARALMGNRADCSDKDVAEIVKAYIVESAPAVHHVPEERRAGRKVVIVGGDYFSQSEYESVRKTEDTNLHFTVNDEPSAPLVETMVPDYGDDFCTETLAQIYAEQGYYEQARDIYSKLILAYPEKSAYFAALIEKLNEEIKN
ncbi:MAG: hypothetical protein NC115_04660 [Bacteroidales bacterium]|nr:hypothetical protein [Bacteroidales bacterium]